MFEFILQILFFVSFGTIGFILLILWALWILYVAMMNINIAKNNNDLTWQSKLLVIPTLMIFNVIEFIANIIVCTLIFLDWPRELTVSDRLRRYYKNPEKFGWRMVLVNFIKPMLDPFDPSGSHIN